MAIYEKNRSKNGFYQSVETNQNLTFHVHLHTSFELLSVLDGEITVQIETTEYRLKTGQQILILPNLIHGYKTEKTSQTRLIIFSEDYLPEIGKAARNGEFRHPVLEGCAEEFDRLIDAKNQHFLFRSELYRIAARYEQNQPIPFAGGRNGEFAAWLSDYLNAHCAEAIDEKSVAKAIGYHPRYLSRLINRDFGVSFTVLLNEYRIRIAQDLLENSTRSITEIYTLSGFDSQSSFNRNFRRYIGVTPREYREARRKKA